MVSLAPLWSDEEDYLRLLQSSLLEGSVLRLSTLDPTRLPDLPALASSLLVVCRPSHSSFVRFWDSHDRLLPLR